MNDSTLWSPAQTWAYALGAPYHRQHRMPLDALPQRGQRLINEARELLKSFWSIETAEGLVRSLNWLGQEGHRVPFGMEIRRYALLRRPQVAAHREELREAGQEDPDALEALWRLDAVQADTDGIRGGQLIGFDAARAVMLARDGWLVGWLTEGVMWDYLLDVARDIQRRFSSWAEYAADFQLSRHVWRASSTKDQFDTITERLLTEAGSPWRTLPWQLPGLAIPRPPRPLEDAAPVWPLERWDS